MCIYILPIMLQPRKIETLCSMGESLELSDSVALYVETLLECTVYENGSSNSIG